MHGVHPVSRVVLLCGIGALVAAAVIAFHALRVAPTAAVADVNPVQESPGPQADGVADLRPRVDEPDRRLRRKPRNRQIAEDLARTPEDLAEAPGDNGDQALKAIERAESQRVTQGNTERDRAPLAGTSGKGIRAVGQVLYSAIAEASVEDCTPGANADTVETEAEARAFRAASGLLAFGPRGASLRRDLYRPQRWPGALRGLSQSSEPTERDGTPCVRAASILELLPPPHFRRSGRSATRVPPLEVAVETNSADYRPGDQVWLFVGTNRPISVRLLLTTPAGVTQSLLGDGTILPAGEHTLPRPEDAWTFLSDSPAGAGEITFLASPSAFGPVHIDGDSVPDDVATSTRLTLAHTQFLPGVGASEFVEARILLQPAKAGLSE